MKSEPKLAWPTVLTAARVRAWAWTPPTSIKTVGIDLFVANLDREDFAIYRNNHDDTFDDLAIPTGIAKATRAMSGWGLKFFDYDNDGNLDLFLCEWQSGRSHYLAHMGRVPTKSRFCCFTTPASPSKTSVRESGPFFLSQCPRAVWHSEILITMAAVDVLDRHQQWRARSAPQ